VVTFSLARVGVLTHRTLLGTRRHATVVIFIVAAVLTPGPHVAPQLLMATRLLVPACPAIRAAAVAAVPRLSPAPGRLRAARAPAARRGTGRPRRPLRERFRLTSPVELGSKPLSGNGYALGQEGARPSRSRRRSMKEK